jgi:pre-mRNA-splicing factor SYF1
MMSAQMLTSSGQSAGTVADLAPGAKDGMRMLEAKAAQMSEPAAKKPTPQGNIMFIRGETQGQEAKDKVVNPDEIDIDDASSEDDGEETEKDLEEGTSCDFSRKDLAHMWFTISSSSCEEADDSS